MCPYFFFFSSRRRHTRCGRDWSSDVCSSDLIVMCQQQITGHNKSVPVIAKLEKLEAIRNLDKILEVADAVMVARGDLGVELKLGDLPAVQKNAIDRANPARVAVITASQMLGTMVTSQ